MLLRKLYFNYFKYKINKAWSKINISSEMQLEYKKYLPQIKKYYKNVTYWHGTGRYHYDTRGKSKYKLESTPSNIVDSFKQILHAKYLKIHEDPWAVSNHKYSSSISTTQWRMYARVYAELHMHEPERISPVFGGRKDVVEFFTYFSLLSSPPTALFKGIKMAFNPKELAQQGPSWFATINPNIRSKGNALSDLIYIVGTRSSNIKNNYGILFGINGKSLKPAKINPIIAMLETRFSQDISLDLITHIEVPLKYIKETKKILEQEKIALNILPLEYCEMYRSTQGIKFTRDSEADLLPKYSYKKLIEHYKRSKV